MLAWSKRDPRTAAATMDVFLVPTGAARHELYCEMPLAPPPAEGPPGTLWGRLTDWFRRTLAEAEAERQREGTSDPPPDRGRLSRFIRRQIAEAVAEQRLLWHLRQQTSGRLVHPDDLSSSQALAITQAQLAADFAKHRRWCVIDGLIAAITGPALFFVPGPNLVSWYFAFRAVGHYFSMRGADAGRRLPWELVPTPHLTSLRTLFALDPTTRCSRLDEIARALGLDRLTMFVERVAAGPS
jgi:hypothetical protein